MTGQYLNRTGSSTWTGPVATALALAAIMGIAEWGFGNALRGACALETGAVFRGEVWRLGCAHLVNLSPTHTFLNILGLGLILATLWSVLTARLLLTAILASAASISLVWVLTMPPGVTYVGFSGVTHGVLAFGGLTMLRVGPRWFGWVILAAIGVKLGHELFIGAVPGADAAIGGRVSFVSHALGTLGGTLAARRAPPAIRGGVVLLCVGLACVHIVRERHTVTEDVSAVETDG